MRKTTRTGLPAPAPPPLRGSLSRGSQPHSCPVAGHLRLRQRYGGSGASGCGCAGNRVRGRESCRGSRRDHGRESCRGSRRGRGSSRGRATAHGRGNNRGRASSRGHGSSPRPCRSRPASSLPRVGGRHHENIPWRRRDGPASSQGSGSCCPTGRARDGDCCGTRHRQRARTRRGETCDRPCQAHRPHRAGAFGGQTRTGLRLPCCRRRWCHARRHHGADPLSSEEGTLASCVAGAAAIPPTAGPSSVRWLLRGRGAPGAVLFCGWLAKTAAALALRRPVLPG